MDRNYYPVIIIGGGASGLFLKHLLPHALLIEKNKECGRKLLLTGGGECNITQDEEIKSFVAHYNNKKRFVSPCLYSFPPEKLISYFNSLGANLFTRSDGKVFPSSHDSRTIRDLLLTKEGIYTNTNVLAISKEDRFIVSTDKGNYSSDILVLATGGASYPATGSTGDGYAFAKQLGHKIVPLQAALSQIKVDFNTHPLEGLSLSDVTLTYKKKRYRGDILFTSRSLSGPLALNLSREIDGSEVITLSFTTVEDGKLKELNGKMNVLNAIHNITNLPSRLIAYLFESIKDKNVASLTKADLALIKNQLTAFSFKGSTKGELKYGMSTRGGIDTDEIDSKTFQSKITSNLYAIGEVLDVDADCGGYSLTFAFASAYAASKAIKEKLN